MYHAIQFLTDVLIDLEVSPRQPLERILIHKDTCLEAQLRPFVVETDQGPVEMADLFFPDGTATRMVPFGNFVFVD